MEIEKLIEQLNDWNENLISELCADDKLTCDDLCDGKDCIVVRAATALSTLQAENASLRKERDAAVEDVLDAAITPCSYCKHGPINGGICDMDNDNHEMFSCWEWRGPEEG